MKKYIIAIFLTAFSLTTSICYGEDIADSIVVDPQDVIFRSSITDIVHDLNDTSDEYSDDRYFQEIDPDKMPLFKQMRLRMSNKYVEFINRDKSTSHNWKFWNKKSTGQEPQISEEKMDETLSDSELSNSINEKVKDSSTLSLEGGINAEKTQKQLMLDADNITFDDETGDMFATGRPKLVLPPQNTTVTADKMQYNEAGNILKAIGNVIVIKDNVPMFTDELEINMNEETLFMDKFSSSVSSLNIDSETALQQDGLVIFNKGNMHSESSYIYRLTSKMFGPSFGDMILNPETELLFFGNPEDKPLLIKTSTLEIDARKNHDVIKAKDIRLEHNNRTFFKWPSLTAYTNKQHNAFEANYPEFGTRRKLGAFIGPGFAFGGPFGSVVKVVPFVNYRSNDWGIGGMLKYMNTHNRTELGYGTAKDIFFLRGKQRLDDNLYFHYAYNSYSNEWFLGGRMPKYIAEIYFDKSYPNKDFLGNGRDLIFRQRASFGFMKDDDRNYNGESFPDKTNMSTTRTRYMAEINQILYNYVNIEKRTKVQLFGIMEGSAALYGNGDTQFVARFGPMLRVQYKNWMQDITYFITGSDDHSPLPHFDAYRYGNSSVRLTEAIRLTRFMSVGWSGYINLSNDSPNGKAFQENAFIVALGPEDFKIVLGYDFVRDRTYFGFNIAFDPRSTNVTYDKMIIKNPERLGKKSDESKERQIAFMSPPKEKTEVKDKKFLMKPAVNVGPKLLEYATVIDLEDPDKERID